MQHLLYGLSAVTLSKTELLSFAHAYNSIFAKLFRTFNKDIILNCQFYSGYLNFDLLLDMNRFLFLSKLSSAGLLIVNSDLDRADYNDFITLQCKYGLNSIDSKNQVKRKLWLHFAKLLNL